MEDKENLKDWEIINEENSDNFLQGKDVYRNKIRKKPKSAIITFIILVVVLSLLLVGMKLAPKEDSLKTVASKAPNNPSNNTTIQINSEEIDDKEELSTEDIADNLIPSIVGITATYTPEEDNKKEESGSASGIVMSEDGYIITNAHAVVSSDKENICQSVQVHLSDGQIFTAQVVGVDTVTDIAVLKISANGLKVAPFGNSDNLKVGQRAVAIGNPIGLELAGSVTQGIISGVSREIQNDSTVKYIQTDAPINPGNSGGALINKYGQVIGINTAKIQSFEGIGFAIPINEAKPIIDDIIQNGYVTDRVKIGITYQLVQQDIIDTMGIPAGMRVVSVSEDTDAYRKGLTAGDIITHINGIEVDSTEQVADMLKGKKAGDSLDLTVYRVEKGKNVTIQLNVKLEMDISGSIEK